MTAAIPGSSGAARRRRLHGAWSAVLLAGACAVATLSAQGTSFRAAVDLIAVDVQVVDADCNPTDVLKSKAFEVSINGRRRQVASAEFIRYAYVDTPADRAITASSAVPLARPTSPGGRTM